MNDEGVKRRRVPRRSYENPVGILIGGDYSIERAYQLGEGGMLISAEKTLQIGQHLVANFIVPSAHMVIVMGVVRNIEPATDTLPLRYGVEFSNLEFTHKRVIRNFVASGGTAAI